MLSWLKPRAGKLVVNAAKLPRGIRYIYDWLHARDLRLGVYTDIGEGSCGPGPGSYGHQSTDAATFAHDWQVDFLNVTSTSTGLALTSTLPRR